MRITCKKIRQTQKIRGGGYFFSAIESCKEDQGFIELKTTHQYPDQSSVRLLLEPEEEKEHYTLTERGVCLLHRDGCKRSVEHRDERRGKAFNRILDRMGIEKQADRLMIEGIIDLVELNKAIYRMLHVVISILNLYTSPEVVDSYFMQAGEGEYKVVDVPPSLESQWRLEAWLNEKREDGLELVAVRDNQYIFRGI